MRNYANTAVETQLAGAIDASATSLEVVQGAGYPDENFAIVIDAEVILVGSRNGNVFSGLQRGYDGTVAASHVAGSWVSHTAIADDYRQIWNVPEHDHDERYYTETEVDDLLAAKSDQGHDHDDRYYTEAEVDQKLSTKSDSDHGHDVATSSTAGFMSSADKEKLDGIEAGATADQNASEVPYDNTVSGLVSTNVQNAIDELTGLIGEGGGGDASEELMLSNDAMISLRLWQLQAAVIGQREGIEGFHGEGFFTADDQVELVTGGMVVRGVLEGEGYASNEVPNPDVLVRLPDPASLPPDVGRGVSWAPDGVYMAVAHTYPPYITIYKRNGDAFTKLSDPSVLPPNTGNGCAFSPDGVYLVVAHLSSPYIAIYERSGDTFVKRSNPTKLPAGTGNDCAFSPDGVHLAVAHNNSPYIAIYKRSGSIFNKLDNPAQLPSGTSSGCAFSPDGVHLAVAHYNSPYITIYKRSGDTFTKLSSPAQLPASAGRGCAFSPDGVHLVVAHDGSPYITIYKREGDTFTKLGNPDVLPANNAKDVSFTSDGVYMAVAHVGSPYITVYLREGDTFTKIPNPLSPPSGDGNGCAFAPDGYLAVAHATSPFVTIYEPIIAPYEEAFFQLVEKTLPYTADSVLIIDSFEGDAGSSRQYQVSLDGGTTWETVTAAEIGMIKQLGHSGSNMKVRLVINSDGWAVGKCFYFVVYAKEVE